MIVQLTPSFKFICDRCGAEEYHITGSHEIGFENGMKITRGQVCEKCYKDFVELAENFFDEANKQEKQE